MSLPAKNPLKPGFGVMVTFVVNPEVPVKGQLIKVWIKKPAFGADSGVHIEFTLYTL